MFYKSNFYHIKALDGNGIIYIIFFCSRESKETATVIPREKKKEEIKITQFKLRA